MLKRVYADNFRSLVNFELRPGQINLLLGPNGSGKTSLFDVFAVIADIVLRGASANMLAFTKTTWDSREVQRFELEIDGNGGTYLYLLEIQHAPPSATPKAFIRAESVTFDSKPLYRFADGQVQIYRDDHAPGPLFPFRSEQLFLANLDPPASILSWFKNFIGRLRVFQLNPFDVELTSKQDQPFLSRSGRNLVSWIRFLSDERPEAKLKFEDRLRSVFPDFRGFSLPRSGDAKLLRATFSREQGQDYHLSLHELSEGQRALAMLYSAIYGMAGDTMVQCFDEPENFVSLPEVQPWLQALRDVTEEDRGQAFVISHHPEVIDYLAADSAFRFERPSGAVARVAPLELDVSDGLKASEIIVRGG